MTPNYANQHIAVLGAGDTGYSIVCYLIARGAQASQLLVLDSREQPPRAGDLAERFGDARMVFGDWTEVNLQGCDLIVASPGVPAFAPHAHPSVIVARAHGVPIVGDIELFAREINALPADVRPRLIGITGTNGKSTVTAMVASSLNAAGIKTTAAGNIGYNVLKALEHENTPDWPTVFALELSSYQLETTESLQLDAAAVLNISQDHMDRYHSMLGYLTAKDRIFQDTLVQVLNRDDAASMMCARQGVKQFSFGLSPAKDATEWSVDVTAGELRRGNKKLCKLDELPVRGTHNALNAAAAHALAAALVDDDRALLHGITHFTGLPHRQVLVANIDGILFYDDSKGTNVGATVAALKGAGQPVVLIAGGDGKQQDFAPLGIALKEMGDLARAVILIGKDAETIARAIKPSGVRVVRANTMAEAVLAATAAARSGDAVLLSPACASFDMFKNYHHRGEVFAESVREVGRNRGLLTGMFMARPDLVKKGPGV